MADAVVKKVVIESYEVFIPITIGCDAGKFHRYDIYGDGSLTWHAVVDEPR